MKGLFVTLLVLALASGLALIAQEHNNATEKKASDEIQFTSPLQVGSTTLEPARYRIACDRTTMTFTNLSKGEEVLAVPCKGKEMAKKAQDTEVHTSLNKDGVRIVDKILLRGSTVEHTF